PENTPYQPCTSWAIGTVLRGPATRRDQARPAHRTAPALREDEGAVLQPGAGASRLGGDGVRAVLAREAQEAELRARGDSPEARLIGRVEAGQHLVQDGAVAGPRPRAPPPGGPCARLPPAQSGCSRRDFAPRR